MHFHTPFFFIKKTSKKAYHTFIVNYPIFYSSEYLTCTTGFLVHYFFGKNMTGVFCVLWKIVGGVGAWHEWVDGGTKLKMQSHYRISCFDVFVNSSVSVIVCLCICNLLIIQIYVCLDLFHNLNCIVFVQTI